jgi:TolB protein
MNRSYCWNSNTDLNRLADLRRTVLVAAILIAILLAGNMAAAAPVPVIRGTIFKVGGEFDPLRIGIDRFTLKDPAEAGQEGVESADLVSRVVFNDLDFSYLIESVRPDTLYMRIMGLTDIDQRGWRHLGAEYVIEGEIELKDDAIAATYVLRDLIEDKRVFKRTLRSRAGSARLLAHVLSDEVYQELTRSPGIFQSRLAYLHGQGDYKEVHICDYDGHNDLAVTADRAVVVTPRWAGPNSISYTSYLHGNPDVWILDLSRDRATKLSSRPGLNSGCAWSRDGKRYVLSLSEEGNSEIYIGRRNSSEPQRLTFSPGIDASPSFSPDGKHIVFTSDRTGQPHIYIMDDDGANVERITYHGHYNESPSWSPTLDLIAYVSRQDGLFQIHTARPDGSGVKQLTEVGSNENPHWSPDGLHIVFSSNRTGLYEIYTMNYDGTEVRRVTNSGNNTNPSWSP